MNAPPDMAKGTRGAALGLNSSYQGTAYTARETPLGRRWSVYAITATGRRKEIALVREEETAALLMSHLGSAVAFLNAAAAVIATDREGA